MNTDPTLIHMMIVLGLGILYFFLAVAIYQFLTDKLGWNEYGGGPVFCAVGWPIFILFWLIIGWPVMFISWLLKRIRRTVKGLITVSREVK